MYTRQKSKAEHPDVQTVNKSQVEIVLGETIPSIEVDSSKVGGDQTSVLSQRREIGEPGHVEVIPWGRRDSPGS